MKNADNHSSRRLSFALRGALLLVAVVAVVAGIGENYLRPLRLKQDAVNRIRQHGVFNDPRGGELFYEPPGPEWLRQLAGPDVFVEFGRVQYQGSAVSDDDLRYLSRVPTLREVNLEDTGITDRGLVYLQALNRLEYLWLEGTQVTPSGVEKLSRSIPECLVVCDFALYRKGVVEQFPSDAATVP